jgi:hypothetical protein
MSNGTILASGNGECQTYTTYDANAYCSWSIDGNDWVIADNGIMCNGQYEISWPTTTPNGFSHNNTIAYVSEVGSGSLSSIELLTKDVFDIGQHGVAQVNDIEVINNFLFCGGTAKTTYKPVTGDFIDLCTNDGNSLPCYGMA